MVGAFAVASKQRLWMLCEWCCAIRMYDSSSFSVGVPNHGAASVSWHPAFVPEPMFSLLCADYEISPGRRGRRSCK